MKQFIYQDGDKFYLVDVYEDGQVTLKIKENGWHDTWSLPIKEVTR
jgi:translation elongation factor P/translation initiation factor 5A